MTSSTRLRQFAATLALASCMSGVALGQRSEARDAAKGRGPDQQIERSAGTGLFVGGQAINSIVLPAEPLKGEKTAAEELTAYLEKMCGIKLKTEPFGKETAARTGALFLGRAAIDAGGFTDEEMGAAEYEGYRMRARNGNVYLAGGKYWGTYWGAMNFLEQLGAHFYAVDHEVVPPTGKVTIHALDLVRKPYLDLRVLKFVGMKAGQHSQPLHTMACRSLDPDLIYVHWMHNSQYLVPFHKYGKTHPEYYAQRRDGAYYATGLKQGHGKLHICMSNPDVRRIAKERLLYALEQQPERRLFTVTQSDGYGWCECGPCRALDTAPGVRTDRLLDFVNELARAAREKRPDVLILTAAYCKDTAPAPKRLKPDPNVRIVLAPYTPEVQDKAHWFDHRLNRQFMPWYKGWVDLLPARQLFIFDYAYADFKSLTFFHEHHFWRIKQYVKDGVGGIYYDSRDRFMFSLHGYVLSRIAWDPTIETRPLIEDFIQSYYGPAAGAMQEIYDAVAKIAAMPDRSQGPTIDMRKFLTTEECKHLFKLFAGAESLAAASPKHLERVKEDKSFLLQTDLARHNPVLGTVDDIKVFKERLGEYTTHVMTKRTNGLFAYKLRKGSNSARSWYWRVARLKIAAKNIKEDPVLKQLMEDPQSVRIPKSALVKRVRLLPDAMGWRIPMDMGEGGKLYEVAKYQCPPRYNVRGLRTRFFKELSLIRFNFTLPEDPGTATLAIEGQDDEKPGTTRFYMALNGEELFKGKNKFVQNDWSTCKYELPAGLLKKGKNELVLENLEEGENIYAQWVFFSDIRIETKRKVKAPPARTLLLAHFDGTVNADVSANPEARTEGEIILSKEGKWGGALDVAYANELTGTVYFDAVDNFYPLRGTLDMWIKIGWDPKKDTLYRTFLKFHHITETHSHGSLMFRYSGRPKFLCWLMYGGVPSISPDITHWKPHSWHHLAFTWDADRKTRQMFFDGVLVARQRDIEISTLNPDRIYVGVIQSNVVKARKRPIGALIDELRISDDVLWRGEKVGQKAFTPPTGPHKASRPK